MKTPITNSTVSFSVDPNNHHSVSGSFSSSDISWSNNIILKSVTMYRNVIKLTDILLGELSNTTLFPEKLCKFLAASDLKYVWQLCLVVDYLEGRVWNVGSVRIRIIKDCLRKAGLSDAFMQAFRFRAFKQFFGLSFSTVSPKDKFGTVIQPRDLSEDIRIVVPEILQDVVIRTRQVRKKKV